MFKKLIEVTFVMKSGDRIKFKCTNIKLARDTSGVTSYTITGLKSKTGCDPLFFVDLNSIESVSYKKVLW